MTTPFEATENMLYANKPASGLNLVDLHKELAGAISRHKDDISNDKAAIATDQKGSALAKQIIADEQQWMKTGHMPKELAALLDQLHGLLNNDLQGDLQAKNQDDPKNIKADAQLQSDEMRAVSSAGGYGAEAFRADAHERSNLIGDSKADPVNEAKYAAADRAILESNDDLRWAMKNAAHAGSYELNYLLQRDIANEQKIIGYRAGDIVNENHYIRASQMGINTARVAGYFGPIREPNERSSYERQAHANTLKHLSRIKPDVDDKY